MSEPVKYRPIMVVGTGSHVGKSVLVTGLCRVFARQGIRVAPFKAQNMALNSGITADGLEMGRAQITQAEAAGIEPRVEMNPILLKPSSQVGSQVVLMGRALGNFAGADYFRMQPKLVRSVMQAFRGLQAANQLVILEGAGSCAELNLLKRDLVNLPMARRAGALALLCADIDTGGVFAQVAGTLSLLTPSLRRLIEGVVINKFRGDPELFADGRKILEKRTGVPVLGLVPRFEHISLPQEDGVALERGEVSQGNGPVRIGVVKLSHISNHTDADALAAEESVRLTWVERPGQLAGLDLLILPGSKNTLAALRGLHESGLYRAIIRFHAIGGKLLGLCGGYQLLGQVIADPLGVEGPPGEAQGLGILAVATEMAGEKTTTRAEARGLPGLPFQAPGAVRGYEIHMGRTRPLGADRPAFLIRNRSGQAVEVADGQVSPDGRAVGTYLHGLADNDGLRARLLAWASGREHLPGAEAYAAFKDRQYDLLADLLEEHLNLEGLLQPLPKG